MEETLRRYEEAIKYDTKSTPKNLLKLLSVKMQIYEILYGKAPTQNTNVMVSNSTSIDIKKLMEGMRKEEDKVVDVETTESGTLTDSPPKEDVKEGK